MPKTRPATWFTAARPYLVCGALALTWLDYLAFARTFPGKLQIFLITAVFLGLSVRAGARIFAGRREAPAFDGNSDAERTPGRSARKMDVLTLIANGFSNKEIAARLSVWPNTVKTHVARAREIGLLPWN